MIYKHCKRDPHSSKFRLTLRQRRESNRKMCILCSEHRVSSIRPQACRRIRTPSTVCVQGTYLTRSTVTSATCCGCGYGSCSCSLSSCLTRSLVFRLNHSPGLYIALIIHTVSHAYIESILFWKRNTHSYRVAVCAQLVRIQDKASITTSFA